VVREARVEKLREESRINDQSNRHYGGVLQSGTGF